MLLAAEKPKEDKNNSLNLSIWPNSYLPLDIHLGFLSSMQLKVIEPCMFLVGVSNQIAKLYLLKFSFSFFFHFIQSGVIVRELIKMS